MSRRPRPPERSALLSSVGRRVAFGAYGAVAEAAVAVARGVLLRGAGEAERAERLGAALPRCGSGRLLLHAVSAGEMTAASALAAAIERTAPGLRVVLTTGTREGKFVAERLRESCGAVEAVSFLPWDRPRAVRRWLSRLAPSVVVTIEAELWPGLFLGARSLGIPVAVASGRLRPGEARRYALARPFFRPVVEAVSWIGARTEEDRERFIAIGASPSRVEVTGDLKLDAPAPSAALPPGWEAWFAAGPPLLVGVSTHAPEEDLLLAAVKRLREKGVVVRLALAPRHVSRGAGVERSHAARASRPDSSRGLPVPRTSSSSTLSGCFPRSFRTPRSRFSEGRSRLSAGTARSARRRRACRCWRGLRWRGCATWPMPFVSRGRSST